MKRSVRGNNSIKGLQGIVKSCVNRKQASPNYQSFSFVTSITDAMPSLVAYFDRKVHCQFANPAYLKWYGRTIREMIGTSLSELMGASLYSVNEHLIKGVLNGDKQNVERFLTRPNGTVGHVMTDYIPHIDANGMVVGFTLFVTDINAFEYAQNDLKLANSVFQNMTEGVFVTNFQGVILSVNPAFTKITGYTVESALGNTPRLLRSDRHERSFYSALWQQLAEHGQWKGEVWNRGKDGALFLAGQTITKIADPEECATRYVSVFHDITDSWKNNEEIRHLAFHDVLTGLPNRALLIERLERRISNSLREPRLIAVMFIDLDGFKAVNDTLGHAVGDELLIAIAQKLQALIRQSDTLARLGGDEFVIKLDSPSNREEVERVAKRVIAVINESTEIHCHQKHVGASVGIALFPEHGANATALVKAADLAMYVAKHTGKNRHHFYTAELGDVSSCIT